MKINNLLRKIEFTQISSKSKTAFHRKVKKGDFVSIIYYDIEKEQIKLQQFTGFCNRFRSKGLNSKITVSSLVNKVTIQQNFFLYSKMVLDISVLKK
jgi:ribosomal protein L19